MTAHGLSGGVHAVILDAEVLAGLFHNGGDAGVMGLDDTREEVMRGLMVQSTCEDRPKPAACGVVLRCGNLQLGPELGKGG